MFKTTAIAIVVIIMLYIVFSIGNASFNSFTWSVPSKGIFGGCTIVVTIIWACALLEERK